MAGDLEPGSTSVGTWIDLEHLAPSPIGTEVAAVATVICADGRRLEFDVTISEGGAVVARGRHRRQVVDLARFLDQLGRHRSRLPHTARGLLVDQGANDWHDGEGIARP